MAGGSWLTPGTFNIPNHLSAGDPLPFIPINLVESLMEMELVRLELIRYFLDSRLLYFPSMERIFILVPYFVEFVDNGKFKCFEIPNLPLTIRVRGILSVWNR